MNPLCEREHVFRELDIGSDDYGTQRTSQGSVEHALVISIMILLVQLTIQSRLSGCLLPLF